MKKRVYSSTITMLAVALALIVTSVVTTPSVARAAEKGKNTEVVSAQQARTVYYPISGLSSGVFTGLQSPNVAVYDLPSGTYTINYSFDASGHAGTIIFTKGNYSVSRTLVGDGRGRSVSITLNQSGRYTVKVTASAASSGIEKSYGFDVVK